MLVQTSRIQSCKESEVVTEVLRGRPKSFNMTLGERYHIQSFTSFTSSCRLVGKATNKNLSGMALVL